MPRRTKASGPCASCRAPTIGLRRGLCYACYRRELRAPGVDCCPMCGHALRRELAGVAALLGRRSGLERRALAREGDRRAS